jgi:hypothetical protein
MEDSYFDLADKKLRGAWNNLPITDGLLSQERKNETRDLVVLLVEGEMSGDEQVDFGIRQIAIERLSPRRNERGIITSPDHQSRSGAIR